MKKALILCTGNSCRSIMAEALINKYWADKWQAFSAGTHPSTVNHRAIKVLQELDIDTSVLRSKGITEFLQVEDLELVITVCDSALQNCPIFPKAVRQVHISIEDPVIYTFAPDEEAMQSFRECRDSIMSKIVDKLDLL